MITVRIIPRPTLTLGYQPTPVESVNGKTGKVVLDATDVGAYPDSNPSNFIDAAGAPVQSVNGQTGDVNISVITNHSGLTLDDGTNPHGTTKTDVGLGNVDNTSDLNKPVSTATQTALDGKVDKVAGKGLSDENYTLTEKQKLAGIEAGAQVNTVTSVNTQTGAVVLTASNVGAYPDTNPSNFVDAAGAAAAAPVQSVNGQTGAVSVGTVTSVTATTPLASSGGNTPNLTIQQANTSQSGFLSNTDWNTFNNKQNVITNPVTGTGADGQVSFWTGAGTQSGDSGLVWDNTNKRLGIGTSTPNTALHITGLTTASLAIARGANFTPTLVAAANNDVLVGLDISPTFTNGSFTGVQNNAIRISSGNIRMSGASAISMIGNNQFISVENGTASIQKQFRNLAETQKTAFTSAFFGDHNDGAVDSNQVSSFVYQKRGTSNVSTNRLINGTWSASSASSGNFGFTRLVDLSVAMNEGSTVSTSITGINLTATKGSTGTITSYTGIQLNEINVSNISYGIRSFINSGLGKWGLYFDGTANNHLAGNLLLGTSTDAGFRLDVNGSTRFNGLSTIQGTTASDSGQLGAELLTTGSSDGSWTGTSFADGYTHIVGSTTPLTSTLAGVVNNFYQITYTVTNRTAGSFTIAFGGFTSGNLAATGNVGPRATTTGTLVITPTSDFNGTIVLSIRVISPSSASVTFTSSGGTVTNQIRISSNNSNTFVGNNAGLRNTTGSGLAIYGRNAGQNNTTGFANSFFGEAAGGSNTTGINNSFLGSSAGVLNITGNNNSFFGAEAGFNVTTGTNNVFIGRQSGRLISGGSNLTVANNSVFIGVDTRANADNETNQIVIGHTAIGLGSNTTVIGNSSTTFGRWWGNLLIGTSTNVASSVLTMDSTTRGFLPPRMTSAQRDAIATPAEGLVVYNSTDKKLSLYDGTSWVNL